MDVALKSKVAGAREALGNNGQVVNAAGDGPPRYELFHAANSICSHKVRCVLAWHRLPYASHSVNMFLGQTYLPGYVRLRMVGCEHFGGALVSHHSGSTSATAGCDGAVVPTLVDWRTGEVIVDSRRICLHLDEQVPDSQKLRPRGLGDAIDDELGIVDNLPNYQMLMGRQSRASESAATRSDTGGAFSQRKVAWCDRYLKEHADEAPLVQAYTAKRAKELSAANELFSPDAMQAAHARAEAAVQALERRLERQDGPWLHGATPTMADLFWGIELLRMRNVGAQTFWEGGRLPRVERFTAASEALPAIRAAVIDWPGAMF